MSGKSAKVDLDAFENLTIHGTRHVFTENATKFKRVFWAIAVLLSTIGLFFYNFQLYVKLSYEPDISIRPGHVFSRKIPFPAVTICTPLFAKHEFIDYHKVSRQVRFNKVLNMTDKEKNYLASNIHACSPPFARTVALYAKNRTESNIIKLLDESSLKTNEALISCNFEDFPTGCMNIFNRVLTERGYCFAFNLMGFSTIFNEDVISKDFNSYKRSSIKQSMHAFDPNAFTSINETNDFLKWSLDKGFAKHHDANYVPVKAEKGKMFAVNILLAENNTANICTVVGNVFSYYIHLPNEILTPSHQEHFVEFRKKSDVVITAKVFRADEDMRDFEPKARGCYFQGEKQLKFFRTYTKALCEYECMTNYTLKMCGCVKFSMPRTQNTPVCRVEESDCYLRTGIAWPDHERIKDEFEAICGCLKTCNYINYEVKYEKVSTGENVMMVLDQYNFSQGDAISRMSFLFDDYRIPMDEEYSAYNINRFVADVGGLLGFFLGCSILSLIEIIYFLFETCCSGLMTRFGKTKTVKKVHPRFVSTIDWSEINRVDVRPYQRPQNGIFNPPRVYKGQRRNNH